MRLHLLSHALLLALLPTSALAAERPVVVELFTSQGCSSCPPANQYLTDLARSGRAVLPLGFHVTYWDRLGWTDPFSLAAATQRQARYGARFGDGSYTPEMVVDGVRGYVGSDREQVGSAIAQASHAITAAEVGVVQDGGQVLITVGAGRGSGRVLLIGFDPEHRTAIPRGENSGRTLTESNVVRAIKPVGDWSGAPLELRVPAPAGAEVAVLLEAPDGRIIGASRAGGNS